MAYIKTRRSAEMALLLLMTAMVAWTEVNAQMFTDEQAAGHIDSLSEQGIKHLLTWRQNLLAELSSVNSTLDTMENILNVDFAVLPNLTDIVISQMTNTDSQLELARNKADTLNLNSSGDSLRAFMKTATSTVNMNGDYDPSNRAGGTYTVSQHGLYQITVRSKPGFSVSITTMRNGNETISSFSTNSYFDIRTRITLMWLNPGDEIFNTGSSVSYFGVMLLRVQTLMGDSLN